VSVSIVYRENIAIWTSLSGDQIKYFVKMLVILSDNILLPFVDGTDLLDANSMLNLHKKWNYHSK
jgi:hypothetical protein